MDAFCGCFVLDKNSETFDDYMKEIGVNLITRTAAKNTKNEVTCCVSPDGTVNLKTDSTLKKQDLKFKLNEEIEEDTLDGRKTKTVFTLENGKLVQRQKATNPKEKDSEIIREVRGDEMITTMKCNGVECTRTYKRKC